MDFPCLQFLIFSSENFHILSENPLARANNIVAEISTWHFTSDYIRQQFLRHSHELFQARRSANAKPVPLLSGGSQPGLAILWVKVNSLNAIVPIAIPRWVNSKNAHFITSQVPWQNQALRPFPVSIITFCHSHWPCPGHWCMLRVPLNRTKPITNAGIPGHRSVFVWEGQFFKNLIHLPVREEAEIVPPWVGVARGWSNMVGASEPVREHPTRNTLKWFSYSLGVLGIMYSSHEESQLLQLGCERVIAYRALHQRGE